MVIARPARTVRPSPPAPRSSRQRDARRSHGVESRSNAAAPEVTVDAVADADGRPRATARRGANLAAMTSSACSRAEETFESFVTFPSPSPRRTAVMNLLRRAVRRDEEFVPSSRFRTSAGFARRRHARRRCRTSATPRPASKLPPPRHAAALSTRARVRPGRLLQLTPTCRSQAAGQASDVGCATSGRRAAGQLRRARCAGADGPKLIVEGTLRPDVAFFAPTLRSRRHDADIVITSATRTTSTRPSSTPADLDVLGGAAEPPWSRLNQRARPNSLSWPIRGRGRAGRGMPRRAATHTSLRGP